MPIRSRHVAVGAAIGVVLAFASCDKSPTTPRPPVQPDPSSPVTVVRLELVAPSEIVPGESVQLTANAIKSDGSVENVSSQAHWTPTTSPVMQLSSTGLFTGKNIGEQPVFASFRRQNAFSATARIFVLPKGTFRLAGTVKESGTGIADVTVSVISGVGDGMTARSHTDGSFALYGVSGSVVIQAKKEGYLNSIQPVDVPSHHTFDFNMIAERPRKDYSGTYTLAIAADEPCRFTSGTFPDEAKRRVYTANVAQDVGRLTVTLTGADFIVTNGYGNRFFGYVDPTDTISFTIGDALFYYYYSGHLDIVERFNGTALMVKGTVTARGTPQLLSGTLNGSILISHHATAPFMPHQNQCYSNTHGFEMVRR